MSFQKLLDDLEALSSSKPADLAKAIGEGAEGDADGGAGEGDADGDADDDAIAAAAADGADAGGDDAGGDDEGDALGKSLKIIGEDGEEQEAIDATDLIKSLVDRVESTETDMTKALTKVADLLKSQATEIGALRGQVGKLASAGRGRRAVLAVSEKPALSKALGGEGAEGGEGGEQPEGMPADQFMAKAMEACTAGRITGLDVSRCEAYINRGQDVPESLKSKVLAA